MLHHHHQLGTSIDAIFILCYCSDKSSAKHLKLHCLNVGIWLVFAKRFAIRRYSVLHL